jgi:hypothetical protein
MASAQPPDNGDVEETAPNQGAPGDVDPSEVAAAAGPGGEQAPSPGSPLGADLAAEHDPFAERPELYVGAAFAGGFLLAQLIRWVRR